MEITKPNDIFVASINNPNSTTLDLLAADLTPDNTSFYTKEQYLQSPFIKKAFTNDKGQFDDLAFEGAFKDASSKYQQMTDDDFIKNLGEITYSPFDVTRPLGSKVENVAPQFTIEFNPFKQLYSRTAINSLDDSNFTLRELAQQNKVYDSKTNTWSEKSANDLGIMSKFFGDTLVYGQWDEDGIHKDAESGRMVNHKKGDWKFDETGNLFLEKLNDREIYGKQVVNPMDMLTTDGSLANKFDFLDSDSRSKSIMGTTAKMIFDIAPFFIPVAGAAEIYGGVKAAISLASILPTFYKSLEGILTGDEDPSRVATAAESYMAKFNQNSTSDEGSNSFFNYEQMSQMVGDIFSQLYEQRAAASLSMLIKRPDMNRLSAKGDELLGKINDELITEAMAGKISMPDFQKLREAAMKKVPELESIIKSQSQLSKSLSLGYMALTQSADVYGQAIEGGYDRRTAGFASLATAAGQYGIMANNRMGDWFLDKTTGYNQETNKALMRKSVLPFLKKIEKDIALTAENSVAGKTSLANTFSKIKDSIYDTFMTPSVIGEAMLKNSIVEGVEEVTEQMVMDATKGIVDTMSFLGLTKKQGSFGGWDTVFSQQGLENYLANFVGGFLGGSLFEFQRSKLEPLIHGNIIKPETQADIYDLIANGHKDEIIDIIKRNKNSWGNRFIGPVQDDGNFTVADGKLSLSVADIITNRAIDTVNMMDGLLNSQDLGTSDEEVVRKALRDQILINQLNAEKGKSELGIEGLILEEYKAHRTKILKLTADIKSLEDKSEENKEVISRLSTERDIHKQAVMDILEGKKAEEYFGKTAWYLSKVISEDFVAIDKETYIQAKYNTSYNELPETGLGVTKKSVNEEFKEYLEANNLRNYIDTGFKAYLNIEQLMNPVITEYINSGYSNEVQKTFKNLLDLATTNRIFDTNDEHTLAKLQNYLYLAKEIEAKTGKRVMPWEAINNAFANTLTSSKAYTIKDGDKLIRIGENEITKKAIAEDALLRVISSLPPDQLDYPLIKKLFDSQIGKQNALIADTYKETLEPLLLRRQELTAKGNTLTEEEKSELEDIDSTLADHTVSAELLAQENIEEFKTAFEEILKQIQNSYFKKGSLTPQIIEKMMRVGVTHIDPIVEEGDYNLIEVLNKIIQILELNIDLNKEITNFTESVNALEITEAEKSEILTAGEYSGTDPQVRKLLDDYNSTLINILSVVNEAIAEFNKEGKLYEIYTAEVNQAKQELLSQQDDMFNTVDILLPAILNEIKINKNLDGELLLKAKDLIEDYLKPIRQASTTFSITSKDVFELLELSKSELESIIEELSQIPDIENENPGFGLDQYVTFIQKFGDRTPNLLTEMTKRMQDSMDKILDETSDALDSFKDALQIVIKKMDSLKSIKELFDSTANDSAFIKNSIYTFIKNFDVNLNRDSKLEKIKLWDLLRMEESKLAEGSSVDAYFSSGYKVADLTLGINTIKLLQASIRAMSTTELSYGDPIGYIASRQNFVKRNNLESEIGDLTTITSDMAELMVKDLDRVRLKLEFLKNLAKHNSGLLTKEQQLIKVKFNKLLIGNWRELIKKNIVFKEKPIIPDLEDILKSDKTDEEKLLLIEERVFTNLKEFTTEEKIQIGKKFSEVLPYSNQLESLYKRNGKDLITKDIQSISNNDMLVYLLSVISVNSRDFNVKLMNALKTKFDKAPFFTQELGLKIMYASTIQKEIFSEVLQSISPITKNFKENAVTYDTSLITYVMGNAGTGKTTVMYKLYLAIMQQSNKALTIWFSAPKLEQVEKLNKDVLENLDNNFTVSQFTKDQLFIQMGVKSILDKINEDGQIPIEKNKSGKYLQSNEKDLLTFINEQSFEIPADLPELIFIDEISHYTALEQHLINEVVKRAGEKGKTIKVFAAGDTLQKGVDFNTINYNVDRVSGVFIPALFLTIRSQNNQKRDNNDLLSTAVRSTSSFWLNKSESSDKVFSDIIQEGLVLHYFLDKKSFNGDKIVDGIIPLDLLLTIASDLTLNPEKTLGILGDSQGKISEDLQLKLKTANIPEKNYKILHPGSIAGQEFNYFIFALSDVKEKHVFDALRTIYTYSSRAKNGSIIINDTDLMFDSKKLKLVNKQDSYTEELVPLSEPVVEGLKNDRIKELQKSLGDNIKISDDFIFNRDAEIVRTSPEDISMSTDSNIDFKESEFDEISKDHMLKFSLEEYTVGKFEGSQNVMVHTFYHDTNVIEYENRAEKTVKIARNIGSPFNYGLDYILQNRNSNEVTLTEEEYNKELDFIVKAKFDILKNGQIDQDDLKRIFNDNTITFSDLDSPEFVITTSTYNEGANRPRKLEFDTKSEQLVSGTKYLNLMYKIVNSKTGELYFLHLGTFPKLSTVENLIKTIFANDVKKQEVINTYRTLFNDSQVGSLNVIDFNSINTTTSTRLWGERDVNKTQGTSTQNYKQKKITLRQLMKTPGIIFYDSHLIPTTGPVISFFPKDFDAFKALFEKTFFGETLNKTNAEQFQSYIKDSFTKRKGKPYITVSYTKEDNVNAMPKSIRFITMHSNTRTWSQIENIINGTPTITQRILQASNSTKPTVQQLEMKRKAIVEASSLFSGNDILDLLISLATQKPELYERLMKSGSESFQKLFFGRTDTEKEIIDKLFGGIFQQADQTVLELITHKNKAMKDIYTLILEQVKLKNITSSDTKGIADLKQLVITSIARTDYGKYWFSAFWNIFKLENSLIVKVSQNGLTAEADKEFLETIGAIIGFWKEQKKEIFYNIPLTYNKTEKRLVGDLLNEDILDNLFTHLAPEGPRLLVNLKGKIRPSVESTESKLDFLNDESNVLSSELFKVAFELGLNPKTNASIVSIRNKIAKSSKSLSNIEQAIAKVRSADQEAKDYIDLQFELTNIKVSNKTIIQPEKGDTPAELTTKIEKAGLIQVLMQTGNFTIEELIPLSILDLRELSDVKTPAETYKKELKGLFLAENTQVDKLRNYLITLLDGKMNEEDDDIVPGLSDQLVSLLNIVKDNGKNIVDFLDADSFATFKSSILELIADQLTEEDLDKLGLLDLC